MNPAGSKRLTHTPQVQIIRNNYLAQFQQPFCGRFISATIYDPATQTTSVAVAIIKGALLRYNTLSLKWYAFSLF